MARARNIKPGFFKNEELAECTPWARLCFAGLWTLADREGRLEDRPKRIKAELFAYDSVEVEPLLDELAVRSFIKRYGYAGVQYIQIPKFVKHQVPHGTERDSLIPDELGMLTVHVRGKNGYATGETHLVPMPLTVNELESPQAATSGLTVKGGVSEGGHNTLNPDSLNPESGFSESLPFADQPAVGAAAEQQVPKGKKAKSTKAAKQSKPGKTVATWEAYSAGYRQRYGAEPLRNQAVNGQLARFVDMLGAEDAPKVAAHYLSVEEPFYVTKYHPVNLMLQDASKLRTQWFTGTAGAPMTPREHRMQEAIGGMRPVLNRQTALERTNLNAAAAFAQDRRNAEARRILGFQDVDYREGLGPNGELPP
jgi:hypothetical protein